MAKLILKNLYKMYLNKKGKPNDTYAVNDFSLQCNDGEFIGILGPSGCGKTTTLRMVAGLEEITDGSIFIGDRLINNLHPKDRGIGLAFEDYALYPPLNVYDNIAFNMRAKRMKEDVIDKEVKRISELLKITDLLNLRPGGLSGGQKQRVNMARAIIRRPEVLLLDEPMSHLDDKLRQQMRIELKRLHKQINCTTVIVTHDQLEAMSLSDRIAIMDEGKLQQYGTPLEVYDSPENEFVAGFIGEPPMNIATAEVQKRENKFVFAIKNSDIKLNVPERYYSVLEDGMKVRIGIRPNDLYVGDKDSDAFKVEVDVFEDLGEERRINIRVGEEFFVLITNKRIKLKKGEAFRLEAKSEKLHVFDIDSGKRIKVEH